MSKSPFKNINVDPQELISHLQKYTEDVMTDIKKEQYKIARKAQKKLRENSPRDMTDKGKHYADGWRIESQYTGDFVSGLKLSIRNKSKPNISHLLENGYIAVKGKNKGQRVGQRVHIRPIQEEANAEFQQKVEDVLRKHGK